MDLARIAARTLGLALLASLSAADDPPEREPGADAPPYEVFRAESKGGLRYTWWLPAGYDGKTPRNVTVILHGTGLDYRWGHWNNKPKVFRPEDVVLSVDGPSPGASDTRLFLGEPADAQAFRDYLSEMRERFAVDRVFLYGHSQGGFFTVYYAGEFPDTVAGVVAHASGAWNWSKMPKALRGVAIAFMHGTGDPVVPYRQSPGSRDAYVEKGFELVHLHRLDQYIHWPNAVRATEALDWCEGMTTSSPERALELALELLRAKPADEYQWETVPAFGAARDVLRRLAGQGPAPLEGVPAEVASQAREWTDAVEEHAGDHVRALRKALGKKPDFEPDGKPWLGHLVPLREDFRGVEAVEAYADEIGYDKKLAAQAKAARPIWDAWQKKDEAFAEAVLTTLAKCALLDTFTPDLPDRMKKARDAGVSLPPKVAKRWDEYEAWLAGWKDGREEYRDLWREWQGPKKTARTERR